MDSTIVAAITYILPIIGALHVGLGIHALRFRKVPAAFPFGMAMFLAAIWACALAMELASGNLADKIFWTKLRIPATSMLAVTWLIMSIRHARLSWLNRRRIAALFIVPAITATLLWTGVYSALYRYNFRLDVSGFFPTLIAELYFFGEVPDYDPADSEVKILNDLHERFQFDHINARTESSKAVIEWFAKPEYMFAVDALANALKTNP